VLHPPRPFPAGEALSSLLLRNLVQQLNLRLFFSVRCGFDPWVRKIPWRRKWQPTR
ncbi:unnamed protein product, partial [Rangifer tarandus platyrhynchus]